DADRALAEQHGISMACVHQRIKRGWGKRKALTTPPQHNKRTADDTTLLDIGRKKYLKRTELKDAPVTLFPPERTALRQRGLACDDLDEVKARTSRHCMRATAPSVMGRYIRLQK